MIGLGKDETRIECKGKGEDCDALLAATNNNDVNAVAKLTKLRELGQD